MGYGALQKKKSADIIEVKQALNSLLVSGHTRKLLSVLVPLSLFGGKVL